MEEEHVWQDTPSQWINVAHWVLLAITLGLWTPIALWQYLVVRCTNYRLSNQRLFTNHGVLSRQEDALELYRVKDSRLEQPFVLRLVGLANIVLETSDPSHPRVVLQAVRDARQVREKIRSLTEARRDQKRVREVDYV